MLKLIEEQLINKNYAYLKLTGSNTKSPGVSGAISRRPNSYFFNQFESRGTGLNLTRADTVILMILGGIPQ